MLEFGVVSKPIMCLCQGLPANGRLQSLRMPGLPPGHGATSGHISRSGSFHKWPQKRPPKTMILIIGTPKMEFLILGNSLKSRSHPKERDMVRRAWDPVDRWLGLRVGAGLCQSLPSTSKTTFFVGSLLFLVVATTKKNRFVGSL